MQPLANLIKLSDDLELDPRAYELRRRGFSVRLERIPMEILLFLIERRPDLVTREQIAEKIWGKNAYGDTDNGINVAIRKIRMALRDDPEDPSFIRTITGKGYRFIATPLEGPAAPLAVTSATSAAPEPPAHPPPEGTSPEVAIPTHLPVQGPLPPLESPSLLRPQGSQPAARRDTRVGIRWWVLAAALVLVGVATAMYYLRRPSVPAPIYEGRQMLAVLPFENLTGDPAQEYFSDGLTEEMISRLGSLDPHRLGVIARTSVARYKRGRQPLADLARDLGVQYVLEGSVRREADRVRIAAQLIQVSDQTHLWARQYERELSSLLAVQEEIAQAVAREIQISLADGRSGAFPSGELSPETLAAYDLYLKGRYFWNKRTAEGLQQAVEHFQRAVERDPTYARGYAGLADSYSMMCSYSLEKPSDLIPKARSAALRALELDDRLAEAHTSLALIREYDLDWPAAEKEFRRAIELDPNYATAHHWFAEWLMFQGRFDEALAESERARRIDPLSLIIAADRGCILFYARRYDEAIEQFRAVFAVEPNFPRAHMINAAYIEHGMFREALAEVERWRRLEDTPATWFTDACIYARWGRPAEARKALDKFKEVNHGPRRVDPAQAMAGWYLSMGDKDRALALMQQALRDGTDPFPDLKINPGLDPVRDDPRFKELLRRIKLDR